MAELLERLERLEAAICEPGSFAPIRQRAYAVEVGGEAWGVVTDGLILVGVRGGGGAASVGLPVQIVETMQKLLDQPDAVDWTGTNAANLLAWVKSHPTGSKAARICPECHGLKVVRCECDCGECGHSVDCDECKQTGKVMARPSSVNAWVYGVYMDLNLLRAAIEHLDLGACQIARGKHSTDRDHHDSIYLRSGGWRVIVMGLNTRHADHGAPRWNPEPAPVSP